MKKFIFNNGETRLENQMHEGYSFHGCCLFWGIFNKETGRPLPYTVTEATEEELEAEEKRRYLISEEHANAMDDDSADFYICPNTGNMLSLDGEVIEDNDCTEELNG